MAIAVPCIFKFGDFQPIRGGKVRQCVRVKAPDGGPVLVPEDGTVSADETAKFNWTTVEGWHLERLKLVSLELNLVACSFLGSFLTLTTVKK